MDLPIHPEPESPPEPAATPESLLSRVIEDGCCDLCGWKEAFCECDYLEGEAQDFAC